MAATLMGLRGREGGTASQTEAPAAVGKEKGAGLLPGLHHCCRNCRPVETFLVTKGISHRRPGLPHDRLGATQPYEYFGADLEGLVS